MIDGQIVVLLGCVGVVMVVGTGLVLAIGRQAKTAREKEKAKDLAARTWAWWWMIPMMVGFLAMGKVGILAFFLGLSFLSLRELVSITPSRRADHVALALAFFVVLPGQYVLVWNGWLGLFLLFLPGWVLVSWALGIGGRMRQHRRPLTGLQASLLLAIYCIGHAPALLMLRPIEGHKLLVFLVVVTQASDVAQFVWGKLLGRRPLHRRLSPNKTVEGLVGGVLTAVLIGLLMTPMLPFGMVVTGALALVITLAGWLGGLVCSAMKREAGIKDFGAVIPGHGGVMDRANSLIFSAPVLFHIVRWLTE